MKESGFEGGGRRCSAGAWSPCQLSSSALCCKSAGRSPGFETTAGSATNRRNAREEEKKKKKRRVMVMMEEEGEGKHLRKHPFC